MATHPPAVGIHRLKIIGVAFVKEIGIGSYFSSGVFTVGGYRWAVRYYHDGILESDKGEYVGLTLALESDVAENVVAGYAFSLLDLLDDYEGNKKSILEEPDTFEHKGQDKGFSDFIKKVDLSPGYIQGDGSLTVKCTLSVTNPLVTNGEKLVEVSSSRSEVVIGGVHEYNTSPIGLRSGTFNVGGIINLSGNQNFITAYPPTQQPHKVLSSSCSSPVSASQRVVGTHLLKVTGISLAKGLGFSTYFLSAVFDVGAYSWAIRYYPDNDDHIGVGLMLQSDVVSSVSASFVFSLLNHKNGKVDSYNKISRETHFHSKGQVEGFNHFFKKSGLWSSSYLENDSMTFRCTLYVLSPFPIVDDSLKKKCGITESELVIGVHDYMISHYSTIGRRMNNKRHIMSDTFSVGGYKWAIKYYPDGFKEEDNAEYISLCLQLQSKAPSVHAQFEFKIAVREKYWSSPMNGNKYVLFQNDKHKSWGVRKFLRRSDLLSPSSHYLEGNCLKIKCILGVTKDPVAESHDQEASSSNSAPLVRERNKPPRERKNPKKKLPL